MTINQPISLNELKNKSNWEDTYKYAPPFNVEIETDARCNRQCDYCPVAYNDKRKGKMSLSFFENIAKQLLDIKFNGHLGFHFYNEPLLDDRLEEFILLARKYLKESILYVITNGDLLTPKRAKSLIKAGLDYIRVSVHDEKIEKNINLLLENLEIEYSKKIVAYNYYKGERVMTTRAGTIQIDKSQFQVVSVEGGCVWSTRLVINYDGVIPLCCDDFHADNAHGDLKKTPLKEIWESSVKKRKHIFNGDFKLAPCLKCLENSK
ncbi:radical SAM protein [Arcobacter sp.]|uniref:radical SAM protein n=1 Tax=Arcobacter sp. TaxID=1872629 RepID=UPI003C72BC3B